METIKEIWMSFVRDVIPADAHPIQVQEMRRAFYAGWKAAQEALEAIHDLPSKADTVEAVGRYHKELQAFAKSVIEGRA